MSLIVPLKAVPNQTLQVVLAQQSCVIVLKQTSYGLFMDLYVNDGLIVASVICENLNRIVRSTYLGFSGDFVFKDTQGDADPIYTGLGGRFLLLYLPVAELGGVG